MCRVLLVQTASGFCVLRFDADCIVIFSFALILCVKFDSRWCRYLAGREVSSEMCFASTGVVFGLDCIGICVCVCVNWCYFWSRLYRHFLFYVDWGVCTNINYDVLI